MAGSMALEILNISSEIIKPSSPTPHHLRNHNLSLVDQYVPPVQVSCLLFYPALTAATVKGMSTSEPTVTLKSSLSDTLADFYPLAGRISDNKSIECGDEGVNFFEARVVGRNLDQVVSDATAEEMEELLPKDNFHGLEPKVLLSVQFNRFDCGGTALGVCIAHKASDASSLSLFLQNWAASARGDLNKIVRPRYDLASIFPGKDCLSTLVFPSKKLNPNLVRKRFVFSASNLAALKAKCAESGNVKNPTRVEAVTALIWRSALNALRMTRADAKPFSMANIPVNLRGRGSPRLSNQYVGNMVIPTMVISGTEEAELDSLVGMIRTTITNVDSEFVRRLRVDEEFQASIVESFKGVGKFEVYTFTSWCRFPFYEIDFGWGRPIWASSTGLFQNSAVLMDTKDGYGVEARVTLNDQEMAKFEAEPDIIAFTSNTARN